MFRSGRINKLRGSNHHNFLSAILVITICANISAASSQCVEAGSRKAPVAVDFLSRSEKVIPLSYEHGEYWCMHVKIPTILVRNRLGKDVRLAKVIVTGMSGKAEMIRMTVHEDEIGGLAASCAHALNRLLSIDAGEAERHRLGRLFGDVMVDSPDLVGEATIPSGGAAAISLSDASYFFYEGKKRIDSIVITVETDSGSAVLEVELSAWASGNKYIYPVRGSSVAASVPFGHSHRFGNGQEFALDIMDIRRFEDGSFSTCSLPNPMVIMGSSDVKDYYIYGREIVAMASGTVIEVAAGFPDAMASNPQDFYGERIPRITPELLEQGVALPNITGGNFVLVDHGNGEYARYCHLRENVPVTKGDRIEQGQVIGYVGNSGNSTEPHLHIELLDSADYVKANGLPILFSDLQLGAALDSPTFGEKNSLIFSEFIFINAAK